MTGGDRQHVLDRAHYADQVVAGIHAQVAAMDQRDHALARA